MSLSLLLTRPALLHGICVWHSGLLPEVLPLQAPATALQGRHAWISHGTQDQVIPLASTHMPFATVCKRCRWSCATQYPCQHAVHPQELQRQHAVAGWRVVRIENKSCWCR